MAAARRSSGLAAAIVTVLVGAGLLALNGGSALARYDRAGGARLAPWDADLQASLALDALKAGRRAQASALASQSLRAMPLGQNALPVLSLAGSARQRVAALNQSAALGWRNPIANFQLIEAGFRDGDPVTAAQRIDAWGRIGGAKSVAVLADRLLLMNGGIEALVERADHHLGRGWIPDWLATTPGSPTIVAARSEFVARLDPGDGAWRRSVVERAGFGFDAANRIDASYALWQRTFADAADQAGLIHDPRFRRLGENALTLGGEWRTPDQPSAIVDKLDQGGVNLSFDGVQPGAVLSQFVEFSAGPIDISADWTGPVTAQDPLRWEITCHRGGTVALARTVTKEGDHWRDRYSAPSAGCRFGWLTLYNHAAAGRAAIGLLAVTGSSAL